MNYLGTNDRPTHLGRSPSPYSSQSDGRPSHNVLSSPVPSMNSADNFIQPFRPSPQPRYTPDAQVPAKHRLLHPPVGAHANLPNDVHPFVRNNDENLPGASHEANKATRHYANGSLNESTNNTIYPSSLPEPSIEPPEHLPYSNGSTLRKRQHEEVSGADDCEQRYKKGPSRLQPTQPVTSPSSCILLAQPTWLPSKEDTPK